MGRRPGPNFQRLRWHQLPRRRHGYYAQDSVTHRHFVVTKVPKGWEVREARENAIGVFDHVAYVPSAAVGKQHCRTLLGIQ